MATLSLPGAATTMGFHKYSSMQEIFTEDKEAFLSAEQKCAASLHLHYHFAKGEKILLQGYINADAVMEGLYSVPQGCDT